MAQLLTTILQALYMGCAALLALYTFGQALLLVQYLRHKTTQPAPPSPDVWPHVTVQLPIYNEQYVVQRALEALAALDYPHLHIQVLDDSTDETCRVVAEGVAHLQKRGISIEQVTRPTRDGYKAGALAIGLERIDSDYVAVFDADFVPAPDFLKRVLPHLLADDRLGLVQTRWSHLNPDENMLTQAQRLAVDTHFMIEQQARSRSVWLMPFNGTGGVWRAAAIEDAGGWNGDTLTEDLDLSYRAQLRGWRAKLLPDVVVPGELPPQLAAYEQQQARWAVGSLQNLLVHGGAVMRSDRPLLHRFMALHHLCQYVPQALMLLMLLLAPPLLLNNALTSLSLAPLGVLGLVPPLMYAVTQYRLRDDWPRALAAFPLLVVLGTGLIWRNTAAMARALVGVTPGFQRTPKFGDTKKRNRYMQRHPWPWPEFLLMVYALLAAGLAAGREPALVPYLLLHAVSFAVVVGWHVRDRLQGRLRQPQQSVQRTS